MVLSNNRQDVQRKKRMSMARLVLIGCLAGVLSGCMAAAWDVRQVETTFINQDNNQEYVQKNAILMDQKTGKTWVLSSDLNSHYYWLEMPVKQPDHMK